MTPRTGIWALSAFIAVTCFFLMLTVFRAATVVDLYKQVAELRQENMILRERLNMTPAYFDSLVCSQVRELGELKARVKKLERK